MPILNFTMRYIDCRLPLATCTQNDGYLGASNGTCDLISGLCVCEPTNSGNDLMFAYNDCHVNLFLRNGAMIFSILWCLLVVFTAAIALYLFFRTTAGKSTTDWKQRFLYTQVFGNAIGTVGNALIAQGFWLFGSRLDETNTFIMGAMPGLFLTFMLMGWMFFLLRYLLHPEVLRDYMGGNMRGDLKVFGTIFFKMTAALFTLFTLFLFVPAYFFGIQSLNWSYNAGYALTGGFIAIMFIGLEAFFKFDSYIVVCLNWVNFFALEIMLFVLAFSPQARRYMFAVWGFEIFFLCNALHIMLYQGLTEMRQNASKGRLVQASLISANILADVERNSIAAAANPDFRV